MEKSKNFSWPRLCLLILAGEMVFMLPFVVTRIFRPTFLEVFGLSNFELGRAFSLYGAIGMISYFLGGPLADRFSARLLMSVALILTGMGGFLMAAVPDAHTLMLLYGYWGFTSVLLFWSALIKATRLLGGSGNQGKAYGALDAGRGLLAAVIGSVFVAVFAWMLSLGIDDNVSLSLKTAALQSIIVCFSFMVIFSGIVVGIFFRTPQEEIKPGREQANEPVLSLSHKLFRVMATPSVWFQSLIIMCAYVGYKCTDDFSLYAKDVLGVGDVEAARLGTVSFWVRPFAAMFAGWIADKFRVSHMILLSFFVAMLGSYILSIEGLASSGVVYLSVVVAFSCVGIYALRGLYFAVFEEAKIPVAFTGCAIGFVSVVGYSPDIFMGPWMGWLLDSNPGALGHQKLFGVLSWFCVGGMLATIGFQFCSGTIQGPKNKEPVHTPPELKVVG